MVKEKAAPFYPSPTSTQHRSWVFLSQKDWEAGWGGTAGRYGEGRRFQNGGITGGRGDNLTNQEAIKGGKTESSGSTPHHHPLLCNHNGQTSETAQLFHGREVG